MARSTPSFLVALVALALLSWPATAVDIHDTRMLSEPAVSAEHVAFSYADDLWVVERGGSTQARRLTSHIGREGQPHFSPDGQWIAFTGEYDGNVDVYLVSVDGGQPTRLTWHPDQDVAQGFTSDGQAILFNSPRASHTRRHRQLFTVAVDGGFPIQLPIPHAVKAKISPDGKKIAYRPQNDVFWQWKNYRGGTHGRIWIYDVATHEVVEVPQPEGRINDTDPAWVGDDLYFISDRAGEFNLFRYSQNSDSQGSVEQLTEHQDFPILAAATGGGVVIYEQAGYLHVYDPATSSSNKLTIGVAADLVELRPRYEGSWDDLRSAGLSPSGSRVALSMRGEIVTVPVEKGDPRYLTQTPGAHEKESVWSPDGKHIAYFSDASGEYELHLAPQDGKGETKTYALSGAGFYDMPRWSPDSKKISFRDNSRSIYWIDLASGEITKVSSDVLYGPANQLHYSWSPDSKWLVHTRVNESNFQQAFVYNLQDGTSHQITDGLSNVLDPEFDAGGKYIYFLASTDSGPVRTWFAQSNADMEANYSVYLAVLAKGEPSPLAAESDEEEGAADETKADAKDAKDAKGKKKGKDAESEEMDKKDVTPEVRIDFAGLDQRILALPIETGPLHSLRAGKEGQIYYLESSGGGGPFGGPPGNLHHFDLSSREAEKMQAGVTSFDLSANGEHVLAATPSHLMVGGSKGALDDAKKVDVDSVRLRIDPSAEWQQIYHEAWRINRDFFYDPGMHGADWDALRVKYAQFLPHLTTRRDLNRLIQWLCSELAVGHHRNGGGDSVADPEEIPGGLLGADYELADGRYRFRKVFGGLNWNPDLRAPLTEPGVDVMAGDYLLAVNGQDLTAEDNLFERFENTADTIVELTVASKADGSDSRTVQVVPIENEAALRNRDWVEGNLRKVDEATDGRVAYVHVPDTAGRGHAYFKRYFFPQVHKDAVIVDERYNGGGQIADYYIDILRRPSIAHWTTRYGQDLHTPLGAIYGPKVMIIDETAGSGGDLLPWMFNKLEIGPLVGKRTWGGLVGILGFPVLMDGGGVTAPNIAIWTKDGFVVESVGVPPDVEVEQTPKEVIAGHDPQLEKAIELALEALEANPPETPERPPFPVRAMQHR